ncbi:MAG: hypothetical protein ACD_80C00012G0013 [uncultured bacterium (gcode 4)]|uniref:Pyruvate kinase n=1 Tax=uncultured bacterium (gcode 4) TaxID=1234023 RepID=K1XKC8_9BACT|nr:MAG: hypothetical protein ACD_80C00012G0013 [uncultured bacterium (gcode 4)]
MLTKIIATITEHYDEQKLIDIYQAWVNVVRINFTHSTPAAAKPIIEKVHKLNGTKEINLSILLDTKWPEIRSGVRDEKLIVKKNQKIKIFIDESKVDSVSDLFCDYQDILSDVQVGQEIIIDSWLLIVVVEEICDDHLVVNALSDAEIGSKRHINLPGVILSLPALIDKDKEDILFGIWAWISFVAASFVRTAENVEEIRKFLDDNWWTHIKIISKIESKQAMDNLEWIVKLSDWVMVARWDLGIELPIHQLPTYQKAILDMCFVYGKPVIIATELLKSMVNNPFPTRAEVSDVYNSVIQRADAVMLSDETTIWKYPIKTIEYMKKVVQEAEKVTNNKHKDFQLQATDEFNFLKKAIARHALMLADEIKAKMVVVFSYTWNLARYMSAFKPNQPIISFTTDENVYRSLELNYGILSEKIDQRWKQSTDNQEIAIKILKSKWMIKKWDYIVVIWERIYNDVHQQQIRIVPVD